jgi:predicted PhzF superfamily epimerase YddE/YHI9
VLILPNERDDEWLQLIAREFNLSETAFLVKRSNTRKGRGFVQVDESGKGLKATKTYGPQPVENEFNLRWFTSTVEVFLLSC